MELDPKAAIENPYVAGGIGALIALRWVPGSTYTQKLFNLAAGCFAAGLFTPFLAEYLGLDSANARAALAGFIGLFGVNILDAAQVWTKGINLSDYLPIKKRGEE